MPSLSYAQIDSIENVYINSIEKQMQQDSFVRYFEELIALKDAYKNYYKTWQDIKKAKKVRGEKMLSLLDRFNVYREPKTDEEKLKVRWYYSTQFYWHRNHSGDYAKALEYGIKGTPYAADSILLDKQAYYTEFEMASIFARKGDHSRAFLYYQKCIPGFKARKELKQLSFAYASIGDEYKWLNDTMNAKKSLNEGLALSKEIDCKTCFIANHSRLRDIALEEGNYFDFLKMAKIDREVLRELPSTPKNKERVVELDISMGNYYAKTGKLEQALILFERAKSNTLKLNSATLKREVAKIARKIALCHLGLNQPNKFLSESKFALKSIAPSCTKVLPHDSLLYAENTFLELFDPLSAYFEHQFSKNNDLSFIDTALQYCEKSIKVSEYIDQEIIYSESKSNFIKNSKSTVDKALSFAYIVYEQSNNKNQYIDRIRNLFNASKDQILKDKIALINKIEVLDASTKDKVQTCIDGILQELRSSTKNENRIIDLQDQIEVLTGIDVSKAGNTQLEGDYLEYVSTKSNVYLLSRFDSDVNFYKLGSTTELQSLINEFNLKIKSKTETKALFEQLFQFLIPESLVLSTSFTIIPDEIITVLPFDLLIHQGRYLIEDHTISIQTHYLQATPKASNDVKNLYCLNPVYKGESEIDESTTDRSGFYPLPFTKDEVHAIKSIFKSNMKTENQKSLDLIGDNLTDGAIFHFTGHAKVNQDSAYLVLSNQDSITKWTFDQIYHNNFDLAMVTLSACETGLGEMQYGDGLNSMARSFLGAGAESVIYSLWTVNDMSTSKIMKAFYTELDNGKPKDEAIRAAKLTFLKSAIPERKHPYYWGGFMAAGNMTPLNISSSYTTSSILLTTFLLMAIVVLIYKTTKSKHL